MILVHVHKFEYSTSRAIGGHPWEAAFCGTGPLHRECIPTTPVEDGPPPFTLASNLDTGRVVLAYRKAREGEYSREKTKTTKNTTRRRSRRSSGKLGCCEEASRASWPGWGRSRKRSQRLPKKGPGESAQATKGAPRGTPAAARAPAGHPAGVETAISTASSSGARIFARHCHAFGCWSRRRNCACFYFL